MVKGADQCSVCVRSCAPADFSVCVCILVPVTQQALKCKGINTLRSSFQSMSLWSCVYISQFPCPLGCSNVGVSLRIESPVVYRHSWLNHASCNACLPCLYHSSFLLPVLLLLLGHKFLLHSLLWKNAN